VAGALATLPNLSLQDVAQADPCLPLRPGEALQWLRTVYPLLSHNR